MSSRKNETSVESRYYKSGLFTNYFLKGMAGVADSNTDHKITAYELYTYVRAQVRKASSNTQTPIMVGHFDKNLVISTY